MQRNLWKIGPSAGELMEGGPKCRELMEGGPECGGTYGRWA